MDDFIGERSSQHTFPSLRNNNMQIELDDWQKEALNHDGNLVLCTGRQVGKTTIMAIKAAEYILAHSGSRIIIVSLTEDQSKLIIVMILDYLEKNHKKKIAKGKDKPTQNKIILTNKSQVLARPVGTTGDAVRGFTGDVLIIDEASRMPDLVWAAGRPTLLTTAGKIWMCSTPYGKKGYFWEAFQNKNNRFKVIHINSEDALRNRKITDFWTQLKRDEAVKFLENERGEMTALQYGQEYLGLFLDDIQRFFEEELIEKCCILKKPILANGKNYLGVDIARLGGDDNSFQLIKGDADGKNYWHVESIIEKGKLTPETERDIIKISELWNAEKIGLDCGSGSLGVGIFDHLRETSLKRKVFALNNRTISLDDDRKMRLAQEDFYNNLKSMLEHGELKLLDDDKIKSSLRSVQFAFAMKNGEPTKTEIFSNPHSQSHAVEALHRAAWMAKKEKSKNFWFVAM